MSIFCFTSLNEKLTLDLTISNSHMISYDFPPILEYFILFRAMQCVYANSHMMRLNRHESWDQTGDVNLRKRHVCVVSRRKLSSRMQKSIAITIHVDRYYDPWSAGRPVGYMVFACRDRAHCATRHCRRKGFRSSPSKVRRIESHFG